MRSTPQLLGGEGQMLTVGTQVQTTPPFHR